MKSKSIEFNYELVGSGVDPEVFQLPCDAPRNLQAMTLKLPQHMLSALADGSSHVSIRFGEDAAFFIDGRKYELTSHPIDTQPPEIFKKSNGKSNGSINGILSQVSSCTRKLIVKANLRAASGNLKQLRDESVKESQSRRSVALSQEDMQTMKLGSNAAKRSRRSISSLREESVAISPLIEEEPISLEDRIKFLLCIRNMSLNAILKRIGPEHKMRIPAVLKRIAKLKPPGMYEMDLERVKGMDWSKWPYSTAELETARKRLEPKPQREPASTVKRKAEVLEKPQETVKRRRSGRQSSQNEQNSEQRLRDEFDELYPEYLKLAKKIQRDTKWWRGMSISLEESQTQKEREAVSMKIRKSFEEKQPDMKRSVERFKYLHEELTLRKEQLKHRHEQ